MENIPTLKPWGKTIHSPSNCPALYFSDELGCEVCIIQGLRDLYEFVQKIRDFESVSGPLPTLRAGRNPNAYVTTHLLDLIHKIFASFLLL